MNLFWLPTLVFGVVLSSCSAQLVNKRSHPAQVKNIGNNAYFASANLNESQDDGNGSPLLGVKKETLGTEFFLQGSLVWQLKAPQFGSIKSRIITFVKKGNQLNLLEVKDGHSITSLSQSFLLTTFEIVKEEDSTYFVDFNKGMNKVFYADDWFGNTKKYDREIWNSAVFESSYLDSIAVNSNDTLQIDQVALLKSEGKNNPLKVVYYLGPYQKNENFVPTRTPDLWKVGYFATAFRVNDNEVNHSHATKFDINQKITYALSANTPDKYKQAVKDGVLYWNKVFGRDLFEAIEAPADVQAPNYNYNLIQWIDWDNAGYAYADANIDPRTGETNHAQIFMTSAFAFGSKVRLQRILRHHQASSEETTFESLLGKTHLCNIKFNETTRQGLNELVASDLTDAQLLEVSKDYVREVVAHEVGHTLGLRHNFAGSMAANYRLDNIGSIFKDYLKTGSAQAGLVTSSSIMDYQLFAESALTGEVIENHPLPLEHDKVAIDFLYHGIDYANQNSPLFCTDNHKEMLDCTTFDAGSSLAEYWQWKRKTTLNGLSRSLMEKFVSHKYQQRIGNKKTPIQAAIYTPEKMAEYLLESVSLTSKGLDSEQNKLMSVRGNSQYLGGLSEAEIKSKEYAAVKHEIKRFGGLADLLKMPSFAEIEKIKSDFFQLLSNPAYTTGKDVEGKVYKISFAEIAAIEESAKNLFAKLPLALHKRHVELLAAMKNVNDPLLATELLPVLEEKMRDMVFSKNGSFPTEIVVKGAEGEADTIHQVELPIFTYPHDLRVAAAALMAGKSSILGLGDKERLTIKEEFKASLDEALKIDFSQFSSSKLELPIRTWHLENHLVLSSFGS